MDNYENPELEHQEKIVKALKEVSNTPNGKLIFDWLHESYAMSPAMSDNPEKTHYLLGQKEFAQLLLSIAEYYTK